MWPGEDRVLRTKAMRCSTVNEVLDCRQIRYLRRRQVSKFGGGHINFYIWGARLSFEKATEVG